MARGYKNKRNYRRKNKKKEDKYSLSLVKLADKKINTLWEVRMQEIAQQQKVTLISRRYFGPTDYNDHYFGSNVNADSEAQSNNWNISRFKRIGTEPAVYTLTAIAKTDINLPLNNPANPNDGDGVTQGMITTTQHDKRMGNNIKIKGISLEFRIINDFGFADNAGGLVQTPPTIPMIAYGHLTRWLQNTGGKCNFYYKVIEVPTRPDPLAPDPNFDKEDPAIACINNEVLPFGYTYALDKELKEDSRQYKYKVLMEGVVNMDLKHIITSPAQVDIQAQFVIPLPFQFGITPRRRTIKHYKKFDDPITIQYVPADQDGLQTENKTIYLVVKTDVDFEQLQDPISQCVAPRMSVCTKVYYVEP